MSWLHHMSISDNCTVHTAQLSVLGVGNLEVDVDCTQHDRSVSDQCLVFKLGVVMTARGRSDTGNDARGEKGKNLGERMCRFLSSQIGCGPVAWLPNTTTHLACFISSLAPASSQIASFNRSHVVVVTHRKKCKFASDLRFCGWSQKKRNYSNNPLVWTRRYCTCLQLKLITCL